MKIVIVVVDEDEQHVGLSIPILDTCAVKPCLWTSPLSLKTAGTITVLEVSIEENLTVTSFAALGNRCLATLHEESSGISATVYSRDDDCTRKDCSLFYSDTVCFFHCFFPVSHNFWIIFGNFQNSKNPKWIFWDVFLGIFWYIFHFKPCKPPKKNLHEVVSEVAPQLFQAQKTHGIFHTKIA